MKKPWQIGVVSIFPGLGFLLLGKIRQGIISLLLVVLFVLLGVFIPIEDLSISAYTLALIAWGSQMYYAVLVAQRNIRLEANPNYRAMQGMVTPLASSASPGEKRLYAAKQDMLPLLVPGEYLKIALPGVIEAPSLLSVLFSLALNLAVQSPVVGSKQGEHVYLGVTESDFLLASTDWLLKPDKLQRLPLSQVKLIAYSEGLITDEVTIEIGESKPLRISVGRTIRSGTKQLAALLLHTSIPIQQLAELSRKPKSRKASASLAQAGISALSLVAGYAIGYGLLHNILAAGDPFVEEVVGDVLVALLCWVPAVIPLAIGIAALMVLIQNRFKFSTQTARIVNGIASLVIGMIIYAPYQFLLLAGAAI